MYKIESGIFHIIIIIFKIRVLFNNKNKMNYATMKGSFAVSSAVKNTFRLFATITKFF